MALKYSKRSKSKKVWMGGVIVVGSLICGGVANMFVTGLAHQFGFSDTLAHTIITYAVYVAALIFAAFTLWVGWEDVTPEQGAVIEARKKARRASGGKDTPNSDQERANDLAFMAAMMAEDDAPAEAEPAAR
jgi:protein-S-isoprenylcysteine O-methyltransferase Ste14